MGIKNLFSGKTTNAAAGLAIYNGIFRYIEIEHSNDRYIVNSALGDHVTQDAERCFSEVFGQLEEFSKNKPPLSVSLPISETMVKVLCLPMELQEARMSLKYELEKYFPVNSKEAIFDIAEVNFPYADQYLGKHFLVAVAKQNTVSKLLNTARYHGYKVECIEPAQIALERSISMYVRQNSMLFIYLGTRYIQYILFWRNNGIFYRSSDFANYEYDDITNTHELAEQKLNKFSEEIYKFLEDAYRETRINSNNIMIFGPSASKKLSEKLEDKMHSYRIESLDILELNGVEMGNADTSAGYWDVPLGLALRHFD